MDAIPSLCASTATCGAAAIGCAYGRLDAAAGPVRGGFEGHREASSPPPILPEIPIDSPLTPYNTPSQLRQLRRPQSVAVSSPLWPGSPEPTPHDLFHGSETRQAVDAPETNTVGISHDTWSPAKASWRRRLSAIAPSRDGSRPSSPRPNSPSPFSHGSSAPFFPSSQVVTPRNKLVKRSTSLRVLHSGAYDQSPLSASQTPTLRRPVTSHQRSEQRRLHQVQQTFEHTETEQTSEHDGDAHPAPIYAPDPVPIDETSSTWQPYFVVQWVREVSSKAQTIGKGSAGESQRCVRTLPGSVPALVRASRITKPSFLGYLPKAPVKRAPDDLDTPRNESDPATANPHKIPRSRHSFSFGDIMSTPPAARRLRRGESARKLRGQDSTAGRRVVSAPQRNSQAPAPPAQAADDSALVGSQAHRESEEPSELLAKRRSSPLPPLKRLSAFQIDDLLEDESATPNAEQHSSSPLPTGPSPGDIDRAGYSSIRFKPRRTSRIPSDRASTAFSSENESSRVFSTDGDDIDYRSETVYDSIRTDATSSSHSGAKGYRADSVFSGASPEPASSIPVPVHERFPSGSKVRDTKISEEEESTRTPVRVQQLRDAETPTPAQRVFHLTPPGSDRSKSTPVPGESGPIGTLPEEDTDIDEFWSVHEERSEWEADDHTDMGFVGSWADSQNVDDDASIRRRSPDRREQMQSVEMEDDTEPWTRTIPIHVATERDSRPRAFRSPPNLHLRSQSVPLPADNAGHRFNNAATLNAWMLGGKGVSEDWDNDFEFEEHTDGAQAADNRSVTTEKLPESGRVLVPPSILERQASVHGQFGQVKQLTQLVEELRRLREAAYEHGLLQGQSSELWREAEGIIDLATLDEDDGQPLQPHSPHSSSVDFDAFDDELPAIPRPLASNPPEHLRSHEGAPASPNAALFSSSPLSNRHGTPQSRPRKESIVNAKHVLENIHQHRSTVEPRSLDEQPSPRKLPFDTTSLRDLVTRAGVVTRALQEIVRRAEDPKGASTPTRGLHTPPDPAFTQIYHQPSTSPPSSRRSPRSAGRRSSGSFLNGSPSSHDNDRNGHMQIMSVV